MALGYLARFQVLTETDPCRQNPLPRNYLIIILPDYWSSALLGFLKLGICLYYHIQFSIISPDPSYFGITPCSSTLDHFTLCSLPTLSELNFHQEASSVLHTDP